MQSRATADVGFRCIGQWRPGRGCEKCNQAGFRGRIALHELLLGTEEIKSMMQAKASTHDMLKQAMDQGMKTLLQDGIGKVLQGLTVYSLVRKVAVK